MANREINEVKINGVTMISTREDTVTKETLLKGVTAHDASGEQIVGELDPVGQDDAYLVIDEEGELADNDYLPFYDSSEGKKKKSLFSHLVDKLKSIFVTISGNTVIEGQELSLKTEVDASKPDNDVEDIYEATLSNILDKEGRIINSMGVEVTSDGKIGTGWIVKNYNTDGQTIGLKGISFSMDKQGNLEYTIADEDAFREAIKTIDQIGTAIPNNSDLDNYKTAGTYAVISDESAQTMSHIPVNVSGKLIVSNNGDGGYTQFYVQNHEAKIFTRSFWNNAWSAWKEIGSGGSGGTHTYQDGTAIAASSNLNSYTTAGVYKVATDAIAETLTNAPSNVAGKLIVYAGVGGGIEQSYMDTDNNEYTRVYDGTTWSDWKKGGSGGSVIFDDTTTVFDEDGDGLFHTYEIGTAIPENADLDNYTEAGVYYVNGITVAESLSNLPVSKAGKLVVLSMTEHIRVWQMYYVTDTTCPLYVRFMDNNSVWYSWIYIANSSNAYMLQGGVVTGFISANDDLNNYTTAGTYDCRFASIASTLSNCPVTDAFKMMVDVEDNPKILTQTITIIHNLSSMPWRRTKNNSDTWSEWRQFSAGAHTYELGTEIPANSDFNDYTTAGVYRVGTVANAETISNIPVALSGKLIVGYNTNDNSSIPNWKVQFYISNHQARMFERVATSGDGWLPWVEYSTGAHTYELGTDIPANSDLNTYTTEGVYRIAPDATATTVTNIPQGIAGKLIVVKGVASDANVNKYKEQFYLTYTGSIYKRTTNNGTSWSEWATIVWAYPKTYDSVNGISFDSRTENGARAIFQFGKDGNRVRQSWYDGTNWSGERVMANLEDVSPSGVGDGYAVATVSGSTITATISGFQLRAGAIVSLMFQDYVTTACTLNISNTGAKSVQMARGVNPSQGIVVTAGVNTFMYDGTYYRHLGYNVTPFITQQSYVADSSGNIIIEWGYGVNRGQLKYRLGTKKLAFNCYQNSAWRGDRVIADYDDIVHQTLGTDIPDNADLNNYSTNGIYNVSSNSRAATISHIPAPRAGKLVVQHIVSNTYVTQIYITCVTDIGNTLDGIYRRVYDGSSWQPWLQIPVVNTGNGMLYIARETTTENDYNVGIQVRIKDTTTGQSFERKVVKWYQDHHETPYGLDMVMDSAGNIIIGSGESATNLYPLVKDGADEVAYFLGDNQIYFEAKANTIANRLGFELTTAHELLPVLAEVRTNNAGSIGNATYKLANVYTNKINGTDVSDITNVANSIISNKSNSTAITSLDDVAINTAGILNLDAATSPINLAGNYIYICYGKDNQKTIELTRMTHGNKNTEERWYNAYNGSSWTGWMPLSRTGTYIGTCATAADQQKKVATVDNDFSLKKGVRIGIKFSNTNSFNSQTSTPITLNVNGTGDKNIYYANNSSATGNTGTSAILYGEANRYHYYVYDGTNWVFDGRSQDNNTTYSPQSLGIGYGTNTEAATVTARAVTLSNYNLTTNGIIAVKFTNAVPAGATLNVNGKGAKSIYYRGVALKANVIKAGDIATFIYSGQYHLLGIDRTTAYDDLITGTGTAAQDKGSGVSPRYFPAKWTFDTGRTATAGDIITIKIPVAGHDYGVFVSVDNGSNYIPVALNGTSRLTTHFPINQTLQLVYEPDTTVNSVYPVAGGDARVNITGVWRVLNYRDNDTVDPCYLGFGYATCATAAATAAKVATLSNYTLRTGGYVSVKFTYDVPANATLNINSRGAKNIYYRGAAIKADVIKAGDLATFVYSGQYHLVGIDRTSYKTNTTSTSAVTAGANITVNEVNISTQGDVVSGYVSFTPSTTIAANTVLLSGLSIPLGGTVHCFGKTENGSFNSYIINSSGQLYDPYNRTSNYKYTVILNYIKK